MAFMMTTVQVRLNSAMVITDFCGLEQLSNQISCAVRLFAVLAVKSAKSWGHAFPSLTEADRIAMLPSISEKFWSERANAAWGLSRVIDTKFLAERFPTLRYSLSLSLQVGKVGVLPSESPKIPPDVIVCKTRAGKIQREKTGTACGTRFKM